MPTIRKICVLVILFTNVLNTLTAETNNAASTRPEGTYSLSLTPQVGSIFGQAEEILFKYSNSDQYVSQLLWDLKPLFYAGIALDFGPVDPFERSGFIAAGSVKIGLPLKTGSMEDRDWLDNNADYLTHYSKHETYIQNAILADISAGYSWRIKDFLVLSAFGEFSFMHFNFIAENGYVQYAKEDPPKSRNYEPWNNSIEKIPIYGAGIRYMQNWFMVSPGISITGRLNRFLSLKGTFSYSPLVFCNDRDDHLLPNEHYEGTLFYGNFYFGHYINGSVSLSYTPVKNLDISLTLLNRYITGMRGDSYYIKTGVDKNDTSYKNYDGGVGYSSFDIKLAATIRVYNRR